MRNYTTIMAMEKYDEASDTQVVGSWGGPVMMEFFIGAPHAGMEDGHSDENTH